MLFRSQVAGAARAAGMTLPGIGPIAPELLQQIATQGIGTLPETIAGASPQTIAGATAETIAGSTPQTTAGLEANIFQPTPPSTPTIPSGIQTAAGPATSDVASYQADQQLLEMMKNYQPPPVEVTPPPAPTGPAPMAQTAPGTGLKPPTTPLPTTFNLPGTQEVLTAPDIGSPPSAVKDLYSGIKIPTTPMPAPEANPFVQGFTDVMNWVDKNPFKSAALGYTALNLSGALRPARAPTFGGAPSGPYKGYTLSPDFRPGPYTQPNVYQPRYAKGGILSLQGGGQPSGPVERMSMMGQQPGMYPQGMIDRTYYATPSQRPASMEVIKSDYDTPVNAITGIGPQFAPGGKVESYLPRSSGSDAGIYRDTDPSTKGLSALDAAEARRKKLMGRFGIPMAQMPKTGIKALGGDMSEMAAQGGVTHLGDYSDGGRLLKGPGDGMSDNIPAMIGKKQPARLADGEFVVPADVVSHLGNGSTDAGAKKLYKMMDKIRAARTGKKKQAPAVKAERFMPA